jgi:hypothetical protein
MNRDEITRIIQDNGLFHGTMALGVVMDADHLERFVKLIVEAERERIKWDGIHSCHPECDKPVCVAIRKAVLEEREACAKVLDEMAAKDKLTNYYVVAALAIRERGAP